MSKENHYLIAWWNCPAGMMVRAAWILNGKLDQWVDWSEYVSPVSRRSARFHLRGASSSRTQSEQGRHVKVMSLKQVEELLLAQKLAATEVK